MIATTVPVRKTTYGRRKQKVITKPVIVSDEEEVEDESVTRCVCGESHSIGLMVCCDECEVWQHCECMGLEEEDIPDQYFCELCRPSDHVQVKGYDNKTRRYYKPVTVNAKIPKKRTTFNSREASIGLEQVLAFRDAIELSKTNNSSKKKPKTEAVLQDFDNQDKQTRKKPRQKNSPSQQKQTRSRTATPQPQELRESSPPAKVRLPSHRMSILEMNKRANQILEYICSIQVEMATNKRKRDSLISSDDDDDDDEEEELQKRRQLVDAQISQAMSKAALELDNKENRKPTPILIPGQYDSSSPSSSLSSASTLPLLDDDRDVDQEKSVAQEAIERMRKPKNEQTSTEIMDLLTRQVITFQRRFGSYCYNSPSCLDDDEESDGPVTRSRDRLHF